MNVISLLCRRPIWGLILWFLAVGASAQSTMLHARVMQQAAQPSESRQAQENEAYQALADVLENPTQRAALIKELRRLGAKGHHPIEATSTETTKSTEDAPKNDEEEAIAAIANNTKAAVASAITLPKRIAGKTADLASDVAKKLTQNWHALVRAFTDTSLLARVNNHHFVQTMVNLALIIATALATYQGLRYMITRIKQRIDHWVQCSRRYKPILRHLMGTMLAAGIDAAILLLAFIVTNAVAFYLVGTHGAIAPQASLFINAFIIIELLKIGLRLIFYPNFGGLRFLPSEDATARHWYHRLATLINLVGYGHLVAVPLVSQYLDNALSQALSTLIAFSAFIYGTVMVMRNRHNVRQALKVVSAHAHSGFSRMVLVILSVLWHWIGIGYFLMLMVLMLLQTDKALPFVLQGTIYTLLIIGGGLLVSGIMTQMIGHRITLPADWRRSIPGVEQRINTYIPLFLQIAHFLIMIFVISGVLSAWGLMDLTAWLQSDSGRNFVNTWTGVFFILFAAALVWMILASMIEHKLSADTGKGKPSARAETLLSLFKNGLAFIVGIITAMMVLSQLGINIGPLIAGAGVLGLAIGFGSQKLVQDIITGIFIQIENVMNTGDVVTVDGITGTAENISIRSVALRDISGTYHLIPFSNVTTVSNYMRGYAYHKAEYDIGYDEDVDRAVEQLEAAFKELAEGEHKNKILEPITVAGVTELAASSVKIRVLIKTTPGDQWTVGRAYNRLVKKYLQQADIEIPYPHTTIYFGEQKNGRTPPLNLRVTDIPEPVASFPEPPRDTKPIISKNSTAATNQPDVDGEL